MLGWIRKSAPTAFVYLCMESKEVWQQVFGFAPSCEKELGNRMTGQQAESFESRVSGFKL